MREKLVRTAARAGWRRRNSGNARVAQIANDRGGEIDVRFDADADATHGAGKPSCERGRDVFSHFEAARSDAGADGGGQPTRRAIRPPTQFRDGFPDDARQRAAPTGMRDRHGGAVSRREEHGGTVRGTDDEGEPGRRRDEAVGTKRRMGSENALRRNRRGVDGDDVGAVDVMRGDRAARIETRRRRKAFAVPPDTSGLIPGEKAEVEGGEGTL